MRSRNWDVFRRSLTLLNLLLQHPLQKDDLFLHLYPRIKRQTATSRLEKDLARLRHTFGVVIDYDPSTCEYNLLDIGELPLLNLPDPALQAVGFLAKLFEPHAPQYANVRALLDTINLVLPPERRAQLQEQAGLSVDLRPVDQDRIPDRVWQQLERALLERRVIEFEYRSPRHENEPFRRHVVEVRDLRFDGIRGHYYVRGYCRYVIGPYGRFDLKRYISYRVGRILPDTVTLLPDRFPIIAPRARTYTVTYQLTAEIARLGVSHHFQETRTESLSDGGVVVRAITEDVFFAARTLLHYGDKCRVLGGSEVLSEMRRIVQAMAQVYELEGNSPVSSTDMEEA